MCDVFCVEACGVPMAVCTERWWVVLQVEGVGPIVNRCLPLCAQHCWWNVHFPIRALISWTLHVCLLSLSTVARNRLQSRGKTIRMSVAVDDDDDNDDDNDDAHLVCRAK
jgi:hypothetical protein